MTTGYRNTETETLLKPAYATHTHTCTITIAIACAGLWVSLQVWVRFGSGRVSPSPSLSFPFSAATRALYLVSSLSSGGSSSRLQNAMVITYIIYHTIHTPCQRVCTVSQSHALSAVLSLSLSLSLGLATVFTLKTTGSFITDLSDRVHSHLT